MQCILQWTDSILDDIPTGHIFVDRRTPLSDYDCLEKFSTDMIFTLLDNFTGDGRLREDIEWVEFLEVLAYWVLIISFKA